MCRMSRDRLLATQNPSQIPPFLPCDISSTIRLLVIAKRGRRGGILARRGFALKNFQQCLINARSLAPKVDVIQYYLENCHLVVLPVTETWLGPDYDDDVLRVLCTNGYSSLLRPRLDTCEDRVAIVYRDSLGFVCYI